MTKSEWDEAWTTWLLPSRVLKGPVGGGPGAAGGLC